MDPETFPGACDTWTMIQKVTSGNSARTKLRNQHPLIMDWPGSGITKLQSATEKASMQLHEGKPKKSRMTGVSQLSSGLD